MGFGYIILGAKCNLVIVDIITFSFRSTYMSWNQTFEGITLYVWFNPKPITKWGKLIVIASQMSRATFLNRFTNDGECCNIT